MYVTQTHVKNLLKIFYGFWCKLSKNWKFIGIEVLPNQYLIVNVYLYKQDFLEFTAASCITV